MTVFLDTGVLYADHDCDASRHDAASTALEALYDGEFGQPCVSDYIYDEAVTLTLKRGGTFDPAQRIGEKIRGVDPYPPVYEFLRVSAAVFDDAVDVFERYDDQALSFTDATTVALCRRHNIDAVMSFDDDFDGVTERVDPRSV
ncbi:type II toxin-antitoxin system VapC family toxin [Halorubrum sp. BV1]|uniref:type II toxin-antitoxin system VapC family toxin n=1 Tax=Halorubrum sp. BV1 TaxID=1498500 RepID=UPI00067879A7|nr:type II toxin-antitoxin system VapC family toxin [Halorubrum sp. BV1]